ncbi:MAG: ester cyclase [Solirubrobacteraceae bacterium]
MPRDQNIAAQERAAERLNSGDIDSAMELFAHNAVDHDPAPDQGPGREGFRAFFKALATAFPDAHIEPAHLVADDDHVCIAYTLTGTHKGPFHGISATDRRIEVRGLQIGRFEHAQIVERWGSTDELGIMEQIGAQTVLDPAHASAAPAP